MAWTQSQRQVFGSVRGVTWGNLVPPFQFVALFCSCAREGCALSEYPKSADCFNDILEKRHRFWAGSPRKMANPPFQFVALFFSCAREDCALSEYPKSADCFNKVSGREGLAGFFWAPDSFAEVEDSATSHSPGFFWAPDSFAEVEDSATSHSPDTATESTAGTSSPESTDWGPVDELPEERRLKNALGRAERTQNSQTAPSPASGYLSRSKA